MEPCILLMLIVSRRMYICISSNGLIDIDELEQLTNQKVHFAVYVYVDTG